MRQTKITQSITNRDSVVLEKYLHEISKIDLLTPDEETAITQRIQQGDDRALQQLVKANLRFVVSVAKQYQFNGLSLTDLINDGNIGLITAAKRFDESKGFKFISYAVWWVRQSIIQAINDKSRLVRIPANKTGLRNRILVSANKLEQLLEREATAEEIAAELLVPLQEVRLSLQSKLHLSLDSPVGDEASGATMGDMMTSDRVKPPDDGVLHQGSLSAEIGRCLQVLRPLEQQVVQAYFGLNGCTPASLDDIALSFGLSKERVRQIKENGLMKLRFSKAYTLLKPFLG